MRQYLHLEMQRVRHSVRFWLVLAVGCTLSVWQYFLTSFPARKNIYFFQTDPFVTLQPNTWYEHWLGGELYTIQRYLFFMLIPAWSVLSYSLTLYEDRTSGYTAQMFSRGKKRDYYAAKGLTAFLCGGFCSVFPLLLNLYLSACTLPSIPPDSSTGTQMVGPGEMWYYLFYTHPNLYILAHLLLIFIFSGLIAVFGMAIGMLIYNRFLISIIPLLLYIFTQALAMSFDEWKKFSPFNFLPPAIDLGGTTSHAAVLVTMSLFIVTAVVYISQAKRDETLG